MSDTKTKTLPYDAVERVCNEIVTLAISVESAATTAICQDNTSPEMYLIKLAGNRIGLLADHITGATLAGNAEYWANLPDMKQAEDKS